MQTRRAFLVSGTAAAGLLLAGCASGTSPDVAAEGTSPGNAGPLVMLIRHGEKPDDGGTLGVLPSGAADDHSLTVTGWTRAGALVDLFDPRTAAGPVPVRTGLSRPAAVIAANPAGASRRPAQTVAPLAAALGVTLATDLAKGQEKDLAERLRRVTSPTLVSWEHEAIPAIVAHLGAVDPAPPDAWPDDRFDLVWCFAPNGGGSWSFAQMPQLLLAGDRSTPA
ncbi:hypothetical protein [Microbacterium sp. SORGH_AS_0888]|uniref:hypothetical protein n=1 Tax=Microbacterium sp. SORGH_AS_0888 TaxID=3041791 RepID=UPI002781462A|nr:hypothetical protein [Microbacterium sp. SORGH_AS_0888]MDQ1128923.1 hypothetical protein [Microbacterium sp. SORGH_AS_0888]